MLEGKDRFHSSSPNNYNWFLQLFSFPRLHFSTWHLHRKTNMPPTDQHLKARRRQRRTETISWYMQSCYANKAKSTLLFSWYIMQRCIRPLDNHAFSILSCTIILLHFGCRGLSFYVLRYASLSFSVLLYSNLSCAIFYKIYNLSSCGYR